MDRRCRNLLSALIKESVTTILEDLSERDEDAVCALIKSRDFPRTAEEFIDMKINDDDFEFDHIELQALARMRTRQRTGNRNATASFQDTRDVKQELIDAGLEQASRSRDEGESRTRGFTSSAHGTHPFAGSGSGGSGMGSNREGPIGFGMGGGPGAIGGKYKWSATDPRNLPMGSRRRG